VAGLTNKMAICVLTYYAPFALLLLALAAFHTEPNFQCLRFSVAVAAAAHSFIQSALLSLFATWRLVSQAAAVVVAVVQVDQPFVF